jgi:hypothetical protein
MTTSQKEMCIGIMKYLGDYCEDFSLRVIALENTVGSVDRARYEKELEKLKARGGVSNVPESLAKLTTIIEALC